VIRVAVFFFLIVSSAPLPAALNAPAPASPILDPEKEGRELAARLCSAAPSASSEFTGGLQITTRNDAVYLVPIASRIIVGPTNWQVIYETAPAYQGPPETLTIIHTPEQPNVYLVANGTNSATPPSLTRPFAQSDFWLMDLGLEFFHWPQQRAIKAEMRRDRACRVLESLAPSTLREGYARVLSWVDVETGGIIQAEAYDRH